MITPNEGLAITQGRASRGRYEWLIGTTQRAIREGGAAALREYAWVSTFKFDGMTYAVEVEFPDRPTPPGLRLCIGVRASWDKYRAFHWYVGVTADRAGAGVCFGRSPVSRRRVKGEPSDSWFDGMLDTLHVRAEEYLRHVEKLKRKKMGTNDVLEHLISVRRKVKRAYEHKTLGELLSVEREFNVRPGGKTAWNLCLCFHAVAGKTLRMGPKFHQMDQSYFFARGLYQGSE